MTKRWSKLLLAGVFFALAILIVFAGFGPSQSDSAHTAAQANPSPSLGFDPHLLIKEFQVAQQGRMEELITKEKMATKAIKNAQNAKQKDFDSREKIARRKFFADPRPGSEKRAYMHDLLARRDAFRKGLADERSHAKNESDQRIRKLVQKQSDNLKKFQDALNRGERPSDTLWPQPGM